MPEPPQQGSICASRRCRECQANLVGRSDKRFCSDYCRNAYHNRHNREINLVVRRINQKLRKNYRILQSVLQQGHAYRIPYAELHALGFDFQWYTGLHFGETGIQAYQVYDLVCQLQPEGMCRIISSSGH